MEIGQKVCVMQFSHYHRVIFQIFNVQLLCIDHTFFFHQYSLCDFLTMFTSALDNQEHTTYQKADLRLSLSLSSQKLCTSMQLYVHVCSKSARCYLLSCMQGSVVMGSNEQSPSPKKFPLNPPKQYKTWALLNAFKQKYLTLDCQKEEKHSSCTQN